MVVTNTIKSEQELVDAILTQLMSSTSILESLRAVTFLPQQFEKVFLIAFPILRENDFCCILTFNVFNAK